MRDWTTLLTDNEKAAFTGADANALIEDAVKAALVQAALVRQSAFLEKLSTLPPSGQSAVLTAASTELDKQVATLPVIEPPIQAEPLTP